MYAHFYRARRRLVVQLVHSRKVAGQARGEHIAPLGSILLPAPFSLAERTRFWRELESRLHVVVARIGARFSDAERGKVIAGLARRIPRPSEGELRRAEISAAVARARLTAERRGKPAARRAPSRPARVTEKAGAE